MILIESESGSAGIVDYIRRRETRDRLHRQVISASFRTAREATPGFDECRRSTQHGGCHPDRGTSEEYKQERPTNIRNAAMVKTGANTNRLFFVTIRRAPDTLGSSSYDVYCTM